MANSGMKIQPVADAQGRIDVLGPIASVPCVEQQWSDGLRSPSTNCGLFGSGFGQDISLRESPIEVREPVRFLDMLLSRGVDANVAARLMGQYYSMVTGCTDVDEPELMSKSSLSSRQLRNQDWRRRVSALPDEFGFCYLRVVRWGRRIHLKRDLGSHPRMEDFVSLLRSDDLDMDAVHKINVYRVDKVFANDRFYYHMDENHDQGVKLGTFFQFLSAMLRLYPRVSSSLIGFDGTDLSTVPLIGRVGADCVGSDDDLGLSKLQLQIRRFSGDIDKFSIGDYDWDDPTVRAAATALDVGVPVGVYMNYTYVGFIGSFDTSAVCPFAVWLDANRSGVCPVVVCQRATSYRMFALDRHSEYLRRLRREFRVESPVSSQLACGTYSSFQVDVSYHFGFQSLIAKDYTDGHVLLWYEPGSIQWSRLSNLQPVAFRQPGILLLSAGAVRRILLLQNCKLPLVAMHFPTATFGFLVSLLVDSGYYTSLISTENQVFTQYSTFRDVGVGELVHVDDLVELFQVTAMMLGLSKTSVFDFMPYSSERICVDRSRAVRDSFYLH